MTIKEIANIITSKNYVFSVSIPSTSFSQGKTTVTAALSNSESIEAYLQNIAETNKAKHLFVKLFTPNGSSFKARGEHLIFLTTPQPVATNTTTVATPLNGLPQYQAQAPITPNTTAMQDKDYIDWKVLEVKHGSLQSSYDELKEKNNKLEKKVEELHDENKQLLRDNLTKEDKHELALERAKLEMAKESKDGLSGLIGDITSNPDTMKMILGIINPKHPIFNEQQPEQKQLEGANTGEVKYTDDEDTNMVLNDIPRHLSQKDGKTIAEVYLVFKELVNDPAKLETAVKTFLPQQ